MLKIPTSLLTSPRLAAVSSDAVVIYLIMRSDVDTGETVTSRLKKRDNLLVSGLDVQTIAQRIGALAGTVIRVQDELVKKGWMTRHEVNTYCLGEIVDFECVWTLDKILLEDTKEELGVEPSLPSHRSLIAKKLAEDRARLASSKKPRPARLSPYSLDRLARPVLEGVRDSSIKPKDILMLFAALYRKKYDRDAPFVTGGSETSGPHGLTYVYIGRAIKWSKSTDEVHKVVQFLFDKWEEIAAYLKLDGPPTFHMIGSSALWPRFVHLFVEGIPRPKIAKEEVVTKRFDDTKVEKDLGW